MQRTNGAGGGGSWLSRPISAPSLGEGLQTRQQAASCWGVQERPHCLATCCWPEDTQTQQGALCCLAILCLRSAGRMSPAQVQVQPPTTLTLRTLVRMALLYPGAHLTQLASSTTSLAKQSPGSCHPLCTGLWGRCHESWLLLRSAHFTCSAFSAASPGLNSLPVFILTTGISPKVQRASQGCTCHGGVPPCPSP